MSITVFISSTSRDLLDHREAVAKALLNAGYHPIDMANFMARPDGAVSACLKEVAESDLFVGIYAWRYGYIPEGAEVSITEQEFIEAERLNKPCFCFMVDETYDWPKEFRDGGIHGRLLRDFKTRLDTKLVRTTFATPNDLAMKVLASLQRWERDNPQKSKQAEEANMGDKTQIGGDKVGGDKIGGDNIKVGDISGGQGIAIGRGASATVSIGMMPDTDDSTKAELQNLIQQLNQVLQQIPQGRQAEAEKVAKMATRLMEDASEEKPDKDMLEISSEGLKKAARNITDVMPDVLSIATKIAGLVAAIV